MDINKEEILRRVKMIVKIQKLYCEPESLSIMGKMASEELGFILRKEGSSIKVSDHLVNYDIALVSKKYKKIFMFNVMGEEFLCKMFRSDFI